MNNIQVEGYDSHGQNNPRNQNPYLYKAQDWDEGWCKRQREQLTHSLKDDEADRLKSFWKWIRED